MFGLTLYDLASFISLYVKARYKSTFWKIKLLGHRRSLVTPCFFFSLSFFLSLSLPLPLLFRLIPWSMEAPSVLLSAWVSKTQRGRRSAPSLPQETGRAPVASVNRANFLSQSFIGFLCKPRNISLFLSSIFLSSTFFPHLSLNQSRMPFLLWVSLDPAGGDPGTALMAESEEELKSVLMGMKEESEKTP